MTPGEELELFGLPALCDGCGEQLSFEQREAGLTAHPGTCAHLARDRQWSAVLPYPHRLKLQGGELMNDPTSPEHRRDTISRTSGTRHR